MITSLIAPSPAIVINSAKPKNRGRRGWAVATIGAMALTALSFATGGTASAAPGGSTVASVALGTSISIGTIGTASFGAQVADVPATIPVAYTVETNNPTGYQVTVEAAAANFVGVTTNTVTFPVLGSLFVVPNGGTSTQVPSLPLGPVLIIHTQDTVSGAFPGDSLTNDYTLTVPNLVAQTYNVTLNYLATQL